jgi:uncharacterized membrane protein YgaE (UPF0421/DUF939 family)
MHLMKNKIRNTYSQFHKQTKIYSHRSLTKHLKKNEFSTQHSMTAVGRCMCIMTMQVKEVIHKIVYRSDDILHTQQYVFLAHTFTAPSTDPSCHPTAVVL